MKTSVALKMPRSSLDGLSTREFNKLLDDMRHGTRKEKDSAGDVFMDKYYPILIKCTSSNLPMEEREDIVGEIIYNLIRTDSKYKSTSNPEKYVASMAFKRSVNSLIRQNMLYKIMTPLGINEDCCDESREDPKIMNKASFEDLGKRLMDSDIIQHVMQRIKDRAIGYSTVIQLYAVEGYTHKEIGEMLNISENTSKSQLSRARKIAIDIAANLY